MGLSFAELLKPVKSWSKSPVVKNPIIVAIIITSILLFIIWFVMRNEVEMVYDDTSFVMLIFKAGIWGLISTLLFVFLHNKAIEMDISGGYKDKNKERLIDTILSSQKDQEGAVKPTIA